MESSTSPSAESSANTSEIVKSSTGETDKINQARVDNALFLTSPLRGLCKKPIDQMSPEELRQELGRTRNLRQNFPGWKAEVSNELKPTSESISQEKVNTLTDSLGDLLK